MITRSICIFPEFEEMGYIHNVRGLYDPLHHLIAPHLSLVFPFVSSISRNQLKEHIISSIQEIKPFQLTMRNITGADSSYLFLNVKQGNDDIIRIHDALYSGILKEYYFKQVTYIPHMTVGRLADKESFLNALQEVQDFNQEFTTVVREIAVEIIDEHEKSEIEFKISL